MLIGLNGFLESGKDTTHGFIEEWAKENGKTAFRAAFADKLKESAANALGFRGTTEECVEFCNRLKNHAYITVDINQSEGHTHVPGEVRNFTGREFLQWYGTESHRNVFGPDFWINQALGGPEYTKAVAAVQDIFCVVTDVRFENEAAAIKERGGTVIRIVRNSIITPDSHASEVPLPESLVDHTIFNESDLSALRRNVFTLMEELYS